MKRRNHRHAFTSNIEYHSDMGESNTTTIPLRPETRDEVKSLKRGGESYDTVVRKLLNGEYPPDG